MFENIVFKLPWRTNWIPLSMAIAMMCFFLSPNLSQAATQLSIVIEAAGSNATEADNIIDENADGSQNLDTFWVSDGVKANGWFTLDLGAEKVVEEIKLAPRVDRDYELDITVGNSLATDGQVSNGVVTQCSTPNETVVRLHSCPLPQAPSGQYVTVKVTNRNAIRVQGVEVWGKETATEPTEPSDKETGLTQLTTTIESTGSNATKSGNIIDENGDGSQNLATYWVSDGVRDNGWFTLNLGAKKAVEEIKLAPRVGRPGVTVV